MKAMIALLTLAATVPVAGCAGVQRAGEVRGTVASVDWPNGVVLLNDVRSAETGAPVVERRAAGAAATTVQPPQQITVPGPSSTIVIEQPARIIIQQAPPRVEIKPAPEPQMFMQAPPASGAAAASPRMDRPARSTLAQPRPWCDGTYTRMAGSNFGKCPKTEGSGAEGSSQTE
jgi:hypothetical protein